MHDHHLLEIRIEYAQLEKFCRQLISRSRDIARTHDALITLETFISNFGRGSQGTKEYQAIESLIRDFTEQMRQQLLQQRSLELAQALQAQNADAIAALHTPLSRNGFYLILQSAAAQLEQQQLEQVRYWAHNWTRTAKQKADELSPYPDAPDFKAAGIALETWLAMSDVDRYLGRLKT